MSFRVGRIELDRGLVAAGRLVLAPQALENLSQIVAANRRVGPKRHGALDERKRGLEIPGLQRDDAKQIQRVRVLGRTLQNGSVCLLGIGQPASPMVLEREREGLVNALLRHLSGSTPLAAAHALAA